MKIRGEMQGARLDTAPDPQLAHARCFPASSTLAIRTSAPHHTAGMSPQLWTMKSALGLDGELHDAFQLFYKKSSAILMGGEHEGNQDEEGGAAAWSFD
jgi:hypothetical protein